MRLASTSSALVVALSALAPVASPQAWGLDDWITADDGRADHEFGISVALSGTTAVVGAWEFALFGPGRAYALTRTGGTWTQQKLTASDGASMDTFGARVDIDGDTLVVGAPEDDHSGFSEAGSAYVFVRSGGVWTEQAKLVDDAPETLGVLGRDVAVSGDTVALAGGFGGIGKVLVFVRTGTTWSSQAEIMASDGEPGDAFGVRIALEGDTLVVSAAGDDHSGRIDAGSAYVFTRSGSVWTERTKLVAPAGDTDNSFSSVALSGGTVATGRRGFGGDVGTVRVFVGGGASWAQQDKLFAPTPALADAFGSTLSLDGETLVVASKPSQGDGTLLVYARVGSSWNLQEQLAPDPGQGPFGASVAIAGNLLVTGAPDHVRGICGVQTPCIDMGSVTVFERTPGTWTQVGVGLAGTFGTPLLTGTGQLAGGDLATIDLTGGPPGGTAILVFGLTAVNVPFKGGVLVPAPDLVLGGLTLDGVGALSIGFEWPPGLTAGTTLWFQYWIPDLGGPFGFAASNGLSAAAP